MTFNPKDHITQLKGKDYLEVKWRIVWFRQEHPDWGIQTEIVRFDDQLAVLRATITTAEGLVVAQGHKQEEPRHFADFLEKAETGAIGRALGFLGYGTQFAPEFEEGERIVDSPVERPKALIVPGARTKAAASAAPADITPPPPAPDGRYECEAQDCGVVITGMTFGGKEYPASEVARQAKAKYGRALCPAHIEEAKRSVPARQPVEAGG